MSKRVDFIVLALDNKISADTNYIYAIKFAILKILCRIREKSYCFANIKAINSFCGSSDAVSKNIKLNSNCRKFISLLVST